MECPAYLKELIKELSAVEFFKITLIKLEEITIKTEEELLLLDKVLYKCSNISKDFKLRLLTPQLQEKFQQRILEMKLDQNNFLTNLKSYETEKGPYNKPKADIPINVPAVPDNPVPKPPQDVPQMPETQVKPYQRNNKPETVPEKTTAPPTAEKRQRSYSSSRRPVEKGSMTPKRARSSSDSSSSSDSEEKEELQVKISKLQNEIARLSATKPDSERSNRASAKYSFSLKKPEGSGRTVLMHGSGSARDDSYFERSSRAQEPRSERGERDFHHDPEIYSPQRNESRGPGKWEDKKVYRSKSYRPPFPFKR